MKRVELLNLSIIFASILDWYQKVMLKNLYLNLNLKMIQIDGHFKYHYMYNNQKE